MRCVALKLSSAAGAAALCAAAAFAQVPAYTKAGPIPPELLTAKRIFISNGGSDGVLFPEPFGGDANRPYTQLYGALKATGKYELVGDPSQADLILYIRLSVPARLAMPEVGPEPMFRVKIYDRKSHYVLWTISEPIEGAWLQKNQDSKFNAAISAVVRDFEQVTGKTDTNP